MRGARWPCWSTAWAAPSTRRLFVLYNDVAAHLDRHGLQPYNPLIGEFVTALDMTGLSLSLFWLDDDLRALLDATAASPAFTSIGPDVAQAARC